MNLKKYKKGEIAYIDGLYKVIITHDDGTSFGYICLEGAPERDIKNKCEFSSNRSVYKLTEKRTTPPQSQQ